MGKSQRGDIMVGFHKDKATGKWFCDDCGAEVPVETILAPYDYFGKNGNKGHKCVKGIDENA